MPHRLEILIMLVVATFVAAGSLYQLRADPEAPLASGREMTVRIPGIDHRDREVDLPVGFHARVEIFIPAGDLPVRESTDKASVVDVEESLEPTASLILHAPPALEPVEGTAVVLSAAGERLTELSASQLLGRGDVRPTLTASTSDRVVAVDLRLTDEDAADETDTLTVTLGGLAGYEPVEVIPRPAAFEVDIPSRDGGVWASSVEEGLAWDADTAPHPSFVAASGWGRSFIRVWPHHTAEPTWLSGGLVLYPGDRVTVLMVVHNHADPELSNAPYQDGPGVARGVVGGLLIPTRPVADVHSIVGVIAATNAEPAEVWASSEVFLPEPASLRIVEGPEGTAGGQDLTRLDVGSTPLMGRSRAELGFAWSSRTERPADNPGPDISEFGEANYLSGGREYRVETVVEVVRPTPADEVSDKPTFSVSEEPDVLPAEQPE